MHKKLSLLATTILFFPATVFAATCYGPSDCLPGQSCVQLPDGRSICRVIAPLPSLDASSSSSSSPWTENPQVLEWEMGSSSSSSIHSVSSISSPQASVTIPSSSSSTQHQSSSASSESDAGQASSSSSFSPPASFSISRDTEMDASLPKEIADAAAQALENEAIEEITVEPSGIKMLIRSHARLFWFIPLPYTLGITMGTDGAVEEHKPWWTLFTAEDEGTIIAELNAQNDNLTDDSPTGLLARMIGLMREVVEGE